MDQESIVFKPPTHDNPIIYAKSWFELQLAADNSGLEHAEIPIEALTARLQQLHIERRKGRIAAEASDDGQNSQATDAEDDEFDASFGRELSFLLNQLRIRNLDIKELPFMPYIY